VAETIKWLPQKPEPILLAQIFDKVDCLRRVQQQLETGKRRPGPEPRLTDSEIITILICFHMSNYRNFNYYQRHVQAHLRGEFPHLVSYTRFIECIPQVLPALGCYLFSRRGAVTGISFIDSTPIPVCHNRRIARHRVFAGLAERRKTSTGWFFGFKLHLVVNDQGELLAFQLTPGNVDDRKSVPQLTERLFGKLFGDKGYLAAVCGALGSGRTADYTDSQEHAEPAHAAVRQVVGPQTIDY
jgi:hypothetical protein